jgi:hypothetical protein
VARDINRTLTLREEFDREIAGYKLSQRELTLVSLAYSIGYRHGQDAALHGDIRIPESKG